MTNGKIFISYRRNISAGYAQAICNYLQNQGCDVFLDSQSINTGQFAPVILKEITEREYFLVILMPGVLDRCILEDGSPNTQDWLRIEIEQAIHTKRNIIPIILQGFDFNNASKYLTGKLDVLSHYNALPIYHEYFNEAMIRLTERYLNLPPRAKAVFTINVAQNLNLVLQAEEHYSNAYSKFEAGDLYGALDEYTQAIHLFPEYAAAYGNRGIVRKRLTDTDGALADYNRAIRFSSQHPAYAEYYFHNRGILFQEREDFASAIIDYTEAILINPRFSDALSRRGTCYLFTARIDKAYEDYSNALKINPNDEKIRINLGYLEFTRGNIQSAILEYNNAIAINSEAVQAWINRSEAYKLLNQFKNALNDLNQAIKLAPYLSDLFYKRSEILAHMDRFDEAIQDMDKVIEFDPSSLAYCDRGWTKYIAGNINGAISDYDKSLELDPFVAFTYNNRGVAYLQLGEQNKALNDFNKAIELKHPELFKPLTNRARILIFYNNTKEAIRDCNHAIDANPQYADAYLVRSKAYEKTGNKIKSSEDYNKYSQLLG